MERKQAPTMLPQRVLRVNRPLPVRPEDSRAAARGVAIATAPILIWTLAWFNLCNAFSARPAIAIDDRAKTLAGLTRRILEES